MKEGTEFLQQRFAQCCAAYTQDTDRIAVMAEEVAQAYTQEGRFYHTTHHITVLLRLADDYAHLIRQRTVMELAIFYHDMVYDVLRRDNEEQSAEIARKRLSVLGVPKQIQDAVCRYIIATKSHALEEEDRELQLFLDFDLAVLAASSREYDEYAHNIRREYAMYDDEVYKAGRRALLTTFLKQPYIYGTQVFRIWGEEQARKNIEREIATLAK